MPGNLSAKISWKALCEGLRCEEIGSAELAAEKLYALKPDEEELARRVAEVAAAMSSVGAAMIMLKLVDFAELMGPGGWADGKVLPQLEARVRPEAAEVIRSFAERMLTRFPRGTA
jgi:hypothetical protein